MAGKKPIAYAAWKPGTTGEDIVNWWIDQLREQEKNRLHLIPDPAQVNQRHSLRAITACR
jgi:hypothetical protein